MKHETIIFHDHLFFGESKFRTGYNINHMFVFVYGINLIFRLKQVQVILFCVVSPLHPSQHKRFPQGPVVILIGPKKISQTHKVGSNSKIYLKKLLVLALSFPTSCNIIFNLARFNIAIVSRNFGDIWAIQKT